MQSSTKMLGTAVAAGLLFVAGQANASLTLQYDTWPDTGGTVTNTGNSGVNGTITKASLTSYSNTGPDDGTLTPPHASVHFADGNGADSTGIMTNSSYNSLVGSDGSMTMAAWVNLDAGGYLKRPHGFWCDGRCVKSGSASWFPQRASLFRILGQ